MSRSVSWEVPSAPVLGAPLCGFHQANHLATVVYRATKQNGAYNHAAMLDFHNGTFLLTWKVSKNDEFCIENEEFCFKSEELCI